MGNVHAPGRPVRGIIVSDDLSTAAPVALYDQASGDAVTFDPNRDTLIVYLLSVSNGGTAAVVTVFDDKDGDGSVDAGEQIFKKSMNASEQAGFALTRGFPLKRLPKAIASAGSANSFVLIEAEIHGPGH